MTTTRRSFLLGASAASLAVLAACSGAPAPSAPPTQGRALTIGLTYIPNVQFSPFYVALDAGLFRDADLEVTLRHHGAQEDLFGALTAGTEEIVFASSDEAVVAAGKNPGLGTFATAFQQFPGVVIVPAASGVASMRDLAGRRIGIPGHFGSTYYAALVALRGAGLTEADVRLTDIGFTQVAALTAGNVDAIVGYSNNDAVQCRLAGLDIVEIPVQDAARPTLVGPGLITFADRLDVTTLRSVALAMAEAERRILADPRLGIDATAKQVPTLSDPAQRKAAEAVLEATSALWLRDGEVSVEIDQAAFDRMGPFLVEAGILESVPTRTTIAL